MYEDIRNYIDSTIKLLQVVNTVTSDLLTTNETRSFDSIEFYASAHSTYISDNYDFDIRMGLTPWRNHYPAIDSNSEFFNMLFDPDTASCAFSTSTKFYPNAKDIPEEELFQKNTVLSDLELCHYYIQGYIVNHSNIKYNAIMSSYDFIDLASEIDKMNLATEYFKEALTELQKES